MVRIGDTITDFELEAFHDGKLVTLKLSDYAGKWLILFFYPADFTFVCPTELEEMADMYGEFSARNTEVLSISCDTVYVHKAWHDESDAIRKITFPMAADPTGAVCREFGVYVEKEGLSLRGTFLIGPDQIVRTSEINDNNIGRSAKEMLRKLEAAQYVHEHTGEVCPASWKPGDNTLTKSLDLVGKI